MTIVRSFDWDEAKRLRKTGLTYNELGDRFGVSASAVRLACDDRARARLRAASYEYQRGGSCIDCGASISRNASRPALRCRQCANLAQSTTVADKTLRCCTCGEWKPDNDYCYTRGGSTKVRRGRHKECRSCQTIARRNYRGRHKVPCANGCGSLVLAPNEQREGSKGLCRSCAQHARWAT